MSLFLVVSTMIAFISSALAVPELTITTFSLSGGSSILVNQDMGSRVTLQVKNTGTPTDGTDISIGFYLSTDATITTADRLLLGGREFIVDALATNGVVTVPLFSGAQVSTTFPNASPLCGAFYLGVVVDEFNAITESNEANNFKAIPVTILCKPDLIVQNFTLAGSNVIRVGEAIGSRISLVVKNTGTPTDGTDFPIGFYISSDATITTTDRLLQGGREFIVDALAAGASVTVPLFAGALVSSTFPDRLPLCGNVYLGVLVDEFNAITENSETNNFKAIPVTILCKPDLIINSFALSGSQTISLGEAIGSRITIGVKNVGTATDGTDVPLGLYISSDATITTADRLLQGGREFVLDAIASDAVVNVPLFTGSLSSATFPNNIPICGNVYLGVLVDEFNAISESNEANNFKAIPVTIICGKPDLVIQSFSLSGSSTFSINAAIGSRISLIVKNNGTASTDGTDIPIGFYISTDATITTTDRLLQGGREFIIDSLSAGAIVSVPLFSGALASSTFPNNIPICGNVYLGVLVDEFNAISEISESNNFKAVPVTITC